ncbi:MAG: alpha/beta fold hydrolase [Paraglaciecola chathamensis]
MPHSLPVTLTRHVDNIHLAYDTFGSQEDAPLVLIMGLGAQRILWEDAFCKMLANQGFWVIRFDNRDVGESAFVEEQFTPSLVHLAASGFLGAKISIPYTLSDMADDVISLMTWLNLPKAHIVGASMGGMIGQILAIEHPDRVLSLTSIMSSVGSKNLHKPEKNVLLKLLKPMPKARDKSIANMVEFWRTLHGHFYTFDFIRTQKLVTQIYERGVNPQGVLRQFAAILAAKERTNDLKNVSLPALVIHGKNDPMLPVSNGYATANAIYGSRLCIYEGMGHTLPIELWSTIIAEITQLALNTRASNER